jgi:hypothetical protein
MEMATLFEVRQETLTALGDGNTPAVPLARMGLPAVLTKWDLFALAGRMYTLSQTTVGTPLDGSAAAAGGIVLTAPTVRFTVPTGYTVFPRRFVLGYATLAGVDNEIAVISSQTDSYTSGGTAITPLNLRTDQPSATHVTKCYHAAASAIVEAALTTVRVHYQACIPLAFAAGESFWNTVVQWDDLRPIVGPASVLIFVSSKTTANTHYVSFDWAEVETSAIKAG